jgi:NitT/TauT family transport system substrate-binding protein
VKRLSVIAAAAAFAASSSLARAQSTAPSTIQIGTVGNEVDALAFYAQDEGFFKKHGIDARIQILRGGSGGAIAAAIVGGAIDIGENDLITLAATRERNLPLLALAPSFFIRNTEVTTALVTEKTSSIHDAKDLVDKVVAVPSLAGPNKLATFVWLEKNGVDPATVKFTEMPIITMGPALSRGVIAAAVTSEPDLTANSDHIRIVAPVYEALGSAVLLAAWNATESWIQTNPDVAKRFVDAMREAAAWANTPRNHPASLAVLQHYTPYDDAQLAKMAKMNRSVFGLEFDLTQIQPLLDAAYAQKMLPAKYDAKDLLSSYARVKGRT